MKVASREKCLVGDTADMEEIFRIKNFPAYIGTTDAHKCDDIENDLIFDISRSSGMVQIRELVPLEVVYDKYHCEAIGPTWKKHHDEFAAFLRTFPAKNIIEVGGSNGYMAKTFLKLKDDTRWTMIDPTPSEIEHNNPRLQVITGFFSKEVAQDLNFDTVVHSHTLEHMYDPDSFIKTIAKNLDKGGHHVFAVPNLRKYFENRYSNVLNFEHTYYLSEQFLEYFLEKYGFEIIEKKYFLDHSIFYSTVKVSDPQPNLKCDNFYVDNKSLLEDYNNYFTLLVEKINDALRNKKFYLFGAHVFSQFLIKKGLRSENIINILDNSQLKDGQRLYGTDLVCKLPNTLSDDPAPIVVVFAGGYQEEIEKQLRELHPRVRIINENAVV